MSGVQSGWNNTQTYMNQYSRLGNRQPPNMVNVPSDLLQAASPKAFDLLAGTKVDMTDFKNVTEDCRKYTGYSGLRALQASNLNRTARDPGCGWILTPGGGGRGAYGVKDGVPTLSMVGEADIIENGNVFIKDLVDAERQAISKIAAGIGSCSRMKNINADIKPFVGYCSTTSQIIPIITTDNGQTVKARFPTDIKYGCTDSDIIPASSSKCPVSAGFQNYKDVSGVLFNKIEEFTDTTFLDRCSVISPKHPDWKRCVEEAVTSAGCRTSGTLYKDPTGQTVAYNRAFSLLGMNGSMTDIDTVYNNVYNIANIAPSKPSSSAAIQELCFQQGYLNENYNWCSEISDSTLITTSNFECVVNDWRNRGGDTFGISSPSFAKWTGKTFGSFREYARQLLTNITELNKDKQVLAISQTIGTPTYGQTYSASPSPPKDCVVSDWSDWSECSTATCGTQGIQTQKRSILREASDNGKPCPVLRNTQPCSVPACPIPRDCAGSWGSWDPPSCDGAFNGYEIPGTVRRRTYTVTPAANGGRTDTCGEYSVTTTVTSNCPSVSCPQYTLGRPLIINNDSICYGGFNFKWLGDYKLQYTIPGNGQAIFSPTAAGSILTTQKDSWNITQGNRNETFGNVMIGNRDMNGIDVGNKVSSFILPNIGDNIYKDLPRATTRERPWVNFLIISEDKASSLIIRNSGIVNVNVSYAFSAYGEYSGNNNNRNQIGLVDQIGQSVGSPRLCGKYKLYYALTTDTC